MYPVASAVLAFLLGLAARRFLDSDAAGVVVFLVTLLVVSALFLRSRSDGLVHGAHVGRLAIWSGLFLVLAVAAGLLLPSPWGFVAMPVVALPAVYLWSLALPPAAAPARRR